jgi:branched-chain amino acid transport system permease protein
MAATVGSGDLRRRRGRRHGLAGGRFLASLLIGVLQTFAVGGDFSLLSLLAWLGVKARRGTRVEHADADDGLAGRADLPYLLLVLMLVLRPRGLLGTREA